MFGSANFCKPTLGLAVLNDSNLLVYTDIWTLKYRGTTYIQRWSQPINLIAFICIWRPPIYLHLSCQNILTLLATRPQTLRCWSHVSDNSLWRNFGARIWSDANCWKLVPCMQSLGFCIPSFKNFRYWYLRRFDVRLTRWILPIFCQNLASISSRIAMCLDNRRYHSDWSPNSAKHRVPFVLFSKTDQKKFRPRKYGTGHSGGLPKDYLLWSVIRTWNNDCFMKDRQLFANISWLTKGFVMNRIHSFDKWTVLCIGENHSADDVSLENKELRNVIAELLFEHVLRGLPGFGPKEIL